MNYEELVKALRYCKTASLCGPCPRNERNMCFDGLHDDAAAAIEALQAELGKEGNRVEYLLATVNKLEDKMPKRGEWVKAIWNNAHILCRCSVCGNEMFTKPDYVKKHKYCFNCGARMDGGEHDIR